MECKDPCFWEALLYLHKAERLRDDGNFSELLVTLNFIKCIELISKSVISEEKNAYGNRMSMKERMELAGKKIGVTKEKIKFAKKAWDVRNTADIAHAKNSRSRGFPNFFQNQSAANEFLQKYYKYTTNNPPSYYIGSGRNWESNL